VTTSALSLLGSFCWIESQPLDVSLRLCRFFNDGLSRLCTEHEGRFVGYAALPPVDIPAAAAEFERALGLPGIVGTQVPGNAFVTRKDADAMHPLPKVAKSIAAPKARLTGPPFSALPPSPTLGPSPGTGAVVVADCASSCSAES
jgi:uncharacterized protein